VNWRSPVHIAIAFLVAGLVVWFSPLLLMHLGLGEFEFVGQVCLAVLALSVLDLIFQRLPGSHSDDGAP
jgi:hypothetical protein